MRRNSRTSIHVTIFINLHNKVLIFKEYLKKTMVMTLVFVCLEIVTLDSLESITLKASMTTEIRYDP